ncbi:MAG TPA: sigma-70 family RNA polymerase sigma factor [Candidatus Acidoferrales bacterium]|nr:sigma-70 family RNA polymerase sigma factor [Candidatus Acidoferrales bacterium]
MEQSPYRAGRKDDFDRLYQSNYQRIFAIAIVLLRDHAAAEDCTQEAFLRAFRDWPRWKDEAPAEAWLYRIAVNTITSWRRRERIREAGELVRRLGRPPTDTRGPSPDAIDMIAGLRELPVKQAAVIVLRHLHGYSNREIALALGVPEQTVASRLAAGKARLRRLLDEQRSQGKMVTLVERGVPSDT